MRKILFSTIAILFLLATTTLSFAATIMYDDFAAWEASVGAYTMTTDYPGDSYSVLAAGSDFSVGYGSDLYFGQDMQVRQIGDGWATWSGSYAGEVLYTLGATSVTGYLSPGLTSFGFEAEPNPMDYYDITLTLADGTSIVQSVTGFYGADFFGWAGDSAIASFTISSSTDFAIGKFVAATSAPVPEPSTMLLLGAGLIGLAVGSRKKLFKK